MKTEYLTSAAKAEQLPKTILGEFSFIGRSNVGKSSLINSILLHGGLARTSRTPGRTQMANFFVVNDQWHFVDLPGYGFSKTANADHRDWQNLMNAYFDRPQIIRNLFLWDGRRELEDVDYQLLGHLSERKPVIFVMTKCDKLNRSELEKAKTFFANAVQSKGAKLDRIFAVSTIKKTGIDELRDYLFTLSL
ncbi:MAG: ribosome biogenesis GTP-binding protein YihA/YsxC [Proteobacteria bacterium]|nr:ribosome biogenesis GTP-binding protein YihA/YsxC [Pseudomonadota bacterium]